MPLIIDLHDEARQATKLPRSIGNRHRVCIKCLPPSATEVTHSTLAFIAQYLTRLVSQRPFLHGYVLFVKEPVCGNLIDDGEAPLRIVLEDAKRLAAYVTVWVSPDLSESICMARKLVNFDIP